jgi:hypothetical protein
MRKITYSEFLELFDYYVTLQAQVELLEQVLGENIEIIEEDN